MHLENTLVWSTTCFPRFVSLLLDKMLYFSKPSFLFKLIHVFTFGVSVGKESAWSAGDLGSIPGLGRSPGEGNGYPLQYSGLENSMDCMYSPWALKELDTTEQLLLLLSLFKHLRIGIMSDNNSNRVIVICLQYIRNYVKYFYVQYFIYFHESTVR